MFRTEIMDERGTDVEPFSAPSLRIDLELKWIDLTTSRGLVVDDRESLNLTIVVVINNVSASRDHRTVEIQFEWSFSRPRTQQVRKVFRHDPITSLRAFARISL